MLDICRGNKNLTDVLRSAYYVHVFSAKQNPSESHPGFELEPAHCDAVSAMTRSARLSSAFISFKATCMLCCRLPTIVNTPNFFSIHIKSLQLTTDNVCKTDQPRGLVVRVSAY